MFGVFAACLFAFFAFVLGTVLLVRNIISQITERQITQHEEMIRLHEIVVARIRTLREQQDDLTQLLIPHLNETEVAERVQNVNDLMRQMQEQEARRGVDALNSLNEHMRAREEAEREDLALGRTSQNPTRFEKI